MKNAKWGLIAVLVIAACAGLVAIYTLRSPAGDVGTPEGLAEQFIANVNAKDRDGQWELIHPKCVKELSSLQREFIDATLAKDFQNAIPKERTIRILTYGEEKSLPFGSVAVWPVRPTHRLEVEFSTGEHPITGIARYLANEADGWFIVVPLIHEERLKQHTAQKSDLDVIGATWHEEPGGALETRRD